MKETREERQKRSKLSRAAEWPWLFLHFFGSNSLVMLWLLGCVLTFTYEGAWKALGATLQSISVLILATIHLRLERRVRRIETEGIRVRLGVEWVDGPPPGYGHGDSPYPVRRDN
jgi:hypothetical protein